MDKFKRGSVWMTMSRNEVNDESLPFGSKTIIIVSNDKLNDKGLISYVKLSHKRYETDTRIKIQINNRINNSVTNIFVDTDEILSIESKYLCCYQGDIETLELLKLTNKLAENFDIKGQQILNNSVAERILKSKDYSNKINEIKNINKKVSDLTQEQKQYIFDNYSKATRDSIAEKFDIYPYEKVTNMANYLRTKFKKKGYL